MLQLILLTCACLSMRRKHGSSSTAYVVRLTAALQRQTCLDSGTIKVDYSLTWMCGSITPPYQCCISPGLANARGPASRSPGSPMREIYGMRSAKPASEYLVRTTALQTKDQVNAFCAGIILSQEQCKLTFIIPVGRPQAPLKVESTRPVNPPWENRILELGLE